MFRKYFIKKSEEEIQGILWKLKGKSQFEKDMVARRYLMNELKRVKKIADKYEKDIKVYLPSWMHGQAREFFDLNELENVYDYHELDLNNGTK